MLKLLASAALTMLVSSACTQKSTKERSTNRESNTNYESISAVGSESTQSTLPVETSKVDIEAASATPANFLFQNVRIFDGKSEILQEGMSVLVSGNKIVEIAKSIQEPEGVTVIDAGNRVMTPGFIGAHEHPLLQMSPNEMLTSDSRYLAYVGTKIVRDYLMSGFTSIRDACGNSFSMKKAIDQGIIEGPRIFPSGPMISQTAGHSDHRNDSNDSKLVGGEYDVAVKFGDMTVADGVPEVLKATRENLRRGATQIKIATGGGVGSEADPLDVIEWTPEEISAAVQAAADWGTYVLAHVYNSAGARRAVENGVKSIEHGNLLDEDTLRFMKDKDVWLSPQVLVFASEVRGFTDDQVRKQKQALAGTDNMFRIAKKIGYTKIAFGTDIVTNPDLIKRMNEEFTLRTQWYTPAEVLRQATSNNADLMALSGPRNPYPGKLGVIESGAYADLLLINGDPLKDISILTRPEENLALIMKDGKIYKDSITKIGVGH